MAFAQHAARLRPFATRKLKCKSVFTSSRSYTNQVLRSCQILQNETPEELGPSDAYVLRRKIPTNNPPQDYSYNLHRYKALGRPVYVLLQQPQEYFDAIANLAKEDIAGFVLTDFAGSKFLNELDIMIDYVDKKSASKNPLKFIPFVDYNDLDECEKIASIGRNVALVGALGMDDKNGLDFDHRIIKSARANQLVPLHGGIGTDVEHSQFINLCQNAKKAGYEGIITRDFAQSVSAFGAFTVKATELKMAKGIQHNHANGIPNYQRSKNDSAVRIGDAQLDWAKRIIEKSEAQMKFKTEPIGREIKLSPGKEDLSKIKMGQNIHSFYDRTVDSNHVMPYETSFYHCDKLYVSSRYAQRLGFREKLIPFNLGLNASLSGSVMRLSEDSLFHLGIHNGTYLRPIYVGDTLSTYFYVKWIKPAGKNKEMDIVATQHECTNQHGDVVFSIEKRTMFAEGQFTREKVVDSIPEEPSPESTPLLDTILKNYTREGEGREGMGRVHDHQIGDVFTHRFVKVFGRSEVSALSRLIHATNDFHYNTVKYREEDIIVPGPHVSAAARTNVLLDYGHILYETLVSSQITNKTAMGDMISTITCVLDKRDIPENKDLEEITLKIFGILNADPELDLVDIKIPDMMLKKDFIKPAQMEAALAETCPSLFHRIGTVEVRKLVRAKP